MELSEIISKDLIDVILKLIISEIERKENKIASKLDDGGIIYCSLEVLKKLRKNISSEKFVASIISTLLKYYREKEEKKES